MTLPPFQESRGRRPRLFRFQRGVWCRAAMFGNGADGLSLTLTKQKICSIFHIQDPLWGSWRLFHGVPRSDGNPNPGSCLALGCPVSLHWNVVSFLFANPLTHSFGLVVISVNSRMNLIFSRVPTLNSGGTGCFSEENFCKTAACTLTLLVSEGRLPRLLFQEGTFVPRKRIFVPPPNMPIILQPGNRAPDLGSKYSFLFRFFPMERMHPQPVS